MWRIMARVGLSLLSLFILAVAILVVMMWVWPCIGVCIVLSVAGATALACRRRAFYHRT